MFRVAGIILILFLPIDMLYQKPFHMTLCANTQICSPIWQRQADGNWNNWFPNLVMIPSHPDFIVDQRYTKIRKTQGPQSWSTLTAINSCACFSSKHIHDQTKTGIKSLHSLHSSLDALTSLVLLSQSRFRGYKWTKNVTHCYYLHFLRSATDHRVPILSYLIAVVSKLHNQ